MYHIPSDKRAIQSAEGLYKGLISCLEKKALADITVMDITSAYSVSRATFYRLFDNATDILRYKTDIIMALAINEVKEKGKADLQKAFILFISSWMKNKELLIALIENNRMDILTSSHETYIGDIEEFFLKKGSLSEREERYLASLLVGIMPSTFRLWLLDQSKTPEEVFIEVKEGISLLQELFE